MIKGISSILLFSLVLCIWARNACGQGDQNIPLPEFYGVYSIFEGKLCRLSIRTGGCNLKVVEVKNGSEKIYAIQYKKGLRFLVYQESPSEAAANLSFQPFLFVRNKTHLNMMGREDYTESSNTWVTFTPYASKAGPTPIQQFVMPLQFLIKPFKPRAVIAVPEQELSAGLYYLLGADANGDALYFWAGTSVEAEALKCTDATVFNGSHSYEKCNKPVKDSPVK